MASDPTFRHYEAAQAQRYAGARPAYPPELYKHIFVEHAASGGGFGFVIDVGCGPGRATRDLAPVFEHVVGVDPGEEMINVARERSSNVKTKKGEEIRFEVGEAERIASVPGVPLGEVDLITAATAAHWFDMRKFWAQAAQLLRPGGTVAIWVKGPYYAHPDTPASAQMKATHEAFKRAIEPYMLPGNRIAEDMYDDLELPWAADPAQTAFPRDAFRRFDWDRGGVLSDGKDFFGGTVEFPIEALEHALGTVSAVTRWREAHPERAGTERDCVAELLAQVRPVLEEKKMRGGAPTVLLMFKRAKEGEERRM